ncbi:Rv3235 family protein [Streptomyces sp. NPDC003730]
MRKVMTRTQLRPSRPPLNTPNGSPASPGPYGSPVSSVSPGPYGSSVSPGPYGSSVSSGPYNSSASPTPYSSSASPAPYDAAASPAPHGAGSGTTPRPLGRADTRPYGVDADATPRLLGRSAPDGRAHALSPAPSGPPHRRPGAEAADPAETPPPVPGGLPPRRPGGRATRATAPGGRPPGSPGRSQRTRTRPADTRPPTPGQVRAVGTGPASPAGTSGRPVPTTRPLDAPAVKRSVHPATAPLVPGQTPRRPVPQLRPTDHFAELLLGVLSGRRPVHSMLRHTVGHAYDDLADLAERGPLRTRGAAPVVRDIGYFEPRPGALEVFARIGAGDRLRALAFRLEQGRDLRWRCTAVELGGRRRTRADDD